MDILFFGSGEFGLPTLGALVRDHRILAVVTQPDRPAGRGGKPTATPVGEWAGTNLAGVPLIKPERVGDADVVSELRSIARADDGAAPATFVVIAFGQKLPRSLLAGVLAINLHASLLPRWRGAAPINAAILAGDVQTGDSVITLSERMDAGLVLAQSTRAIEPQITAGELHDLLASDGPALVQRVLAESEAGRLTARTQDESLVTRAMKLSKADGWTDFSHSAEECRRRINGLSPWPGVTVQFRGEPLKLVRATVRGNSHAHPSDPSGSVIDTHEGVVACGMGTLLRLLEVQPPGKRVMPWQDFANGHRVKSQETLVGGPPQC
jgi:methionyl-tRNA formyltransferase